jgi:hypothetical protein
VEEELGDLRGRGHRRDDRNGPEPGDDSVTAEADIPTRAMADSRPAQRGPRTLAGWAGLAVAVLAVGALAHATPSAHEPTPAAASAETGLVDIGGSISPDVVDLSGQHVSSLPPGLCQLVPGLTHLTIRRVQTLPENRLSFTIPAASTVDDPRQVQAVAEAACQLPTMPDGVHHCPLDVGVTQHLTFATATRTLPEIVIAAGGCQTVTGLGPVRWWADPVWQALRSALHVPGSVSEAFFGALPPSSV